MSIMDKITGTYEEGRGRPGRRRVAAPRGRREERKGEAKDQLDNAQDKAAQKGRRGRGPRAQDLISPARAKGAAHRWGTSRRAVSAVASL